MSTEPKYIAFALVALSATTPFFEICHAQTSVVLTEKIRLTSEKADGPYKYKSPSDPIAIVGFVTAAKGNDVVFKDCKGNEHNLKRSDLQRIDRPCPPGSPITPWVVDKTGKLVPAPGYTLMVHMEKPQIDPASLPPDYRKEIVGSKVGEWAAVSYPAEKGKLDLSIIAKPDAQ